MIPWLQSSNSNDILNVTFVTLLKNNYIKLIKSLKRKSFHLTL